MLLRDWADAQQPPIKPKALGELLEITRPHAWRLLSGEGFPQAELRRRIYAVTGGAVDANALAAAQDECLGLPPVETLLR